MKKNLVVAVLYTLVTTVLFGIIYPLVVTGLAQVIFPRQANGELIRSGDKLVGSRLMGQPFTAPGYFWSRPSAAGTAGYDPTASGGSNLGPTNKTLIDRVTASVQALQADKSGRAGSGGPGDHVRLGARSGYFARVGCISGSARGAGTRHERAGRARAGRKAHRGAPAGVSGRAACQRAGAESGLGCGSSAPIGHPRR